MAGWIEAEDARSFGLCRTLGVKLQDIYFISLDCFEFLFSKGVASWSGRSGNKGSEVLYGCE